MCPVPFCAAGGLLIWPPRYGPLQCVHVLLGCNLPGVLEAKDGHPGPSLGLHGLSRRRGLTFLPFSLAFSTNMPLQKSYVSHPWQKIGIANPNHKGQVLIWKWAKHDFLKQCGRRCFIEWVNEKSWKWVVVFLSWQDDRLFVSRVIVALFVSPSGNALSLPLHLATFFS